MLQVMMHKRVGSFKMCFLAVALGAAVLPLFSCRSVNPNSVSYGAIPVPVAGSPAGPAASTQWVVAWGANPENASTTTENPGGTEQTFRFFFVPTIDGTQERLHFSNAYGKAPITIGAARLAVGLNYQAAVDPKRNVPLTFGGATSVTIPVGGQVISDTVNLSYKYGERLAVSMYVSGTFAPLTQHDSQVNINFLAPQGSGDVTPDYGGVNFTETVTEYYLVSGMDVYGSYQGTVAIFGSSSVDGHNSNLGTGNNYPTPNLPVPGQDFDRPSDWLARQLLAAGYRMGVENAGTLGDPAGEDARTKTGASAAGVDRMNRDVLQQPGIKAVVIYFGGVDLRSDCVPATSVEASLSNMIAQANAVGVRVILATVPPAEYCTTSDASLLPSTSNPYQGDINPGPENPGSTQRNLLNVWIKSTGANLPGVVAIADYDAALLYTAHPDFMQPQWYTNDNFHPNGIGYGVQSAATPLAALLGK